MKKSEARAILAEREKRETLRAELSKRIDETFEFIDYQTVKGKWGVAKLWKMPKVAVYSAIGVNCNDVPTAKVAKELLVERGVRSAKVWPRVVDVFVGLRLKADCNAYGEDPQQSPTGSRAA